MKPASNGGEVVLEVSDLGPGIPFEEREHALRRFYRLEHSRNTLGNGLGLSLVVAVANLHGACMVVCVLFRAVSDRSCPGDTEALVVDRLAHELR